MRKIGFLLICVCILIPLTACNSEKETKRQSEKDNLEINEETKEDPSCQHIWQEATCTMAKKCTLCSEISGLNLGHDWIEASYEAPLTCKRCGAVDGEKLKLSDECDKVLCSGEYNGNSYEVVLNEREDYSGLYLEIGVIKNNRWVLEPTPDMPFITTKVYDTEKKSFGEIHYIGQGCFLCQKENSGSYAYAIYSAENGKSITRDRWYQPLPIICSNTDEFFIIHQGRYNGDNRLWNTDNCFTVLNKTTMTTSEIILEDGISDWADGAHYRFSNISEGVFWIAPAGRNETAFYDINGKKVIDLSPYYISFKWHLNFANGTCCFYIKNENDSYYLITIDKSGKVLSSEPASLHDFGV